VPEAVIELVEMFSSLEVAIMPFPSSASGNKMRSRAVPEAVIELVEMFSKAHPSLNTKHQTPLNISPKL